MKFIMMSLFALALAGCSSDTVSSSTRCYDNTCNGVASGEKCFSSNTAFCESLCAESDCLSVQQCADECDGVAPEPEKEKPRCFYQCFSNEAYCLNAETQAECDELVAKDCKGTTPTEAATWSEDCRSCDAGGCAPQWWTDWENSK